MIHYAFDTGNSLRRDDKALTFAIIGDNSVQLGDAVLDDHVDVGRPILSRNCRHDAVADRRIIASRRIGITCKTRERMHQVGTADNADNAAAAGHRNALDAMALHHIDDSLERFVFAYRLWIRRHDIFNFFARCLHVFLSELAWPKDEFEPFRAAPLRTKFTAPQKIALGNDTNELAFLVDDGQAADLMPQHQTRSVDDSLVRANGNDFGRHDVFDSHCPILNLEVAEKASAL